MLNPVVIQASKEFDEEKVECSSVQIESRRDPTPTCKRSPYLSHNSLYCSINSTTHIHCIIKYVYPSEYKGHFDGVLIDHADIRQRVRELALLLNTEYKDQRPVLICTLKGACTFFIHLTDYLQELRQGYDIEFFRASSYNGVNTTGNVTMYSDLLDMKAIQNRHVVIIEDIVDTGTTLSHVVPIIKEQGNPKSIEVCTLLDKRLDDGDKKHFVAKYCGFSIPNLFIIGYGYVSIYVSIELLCK